MGRVGIPQRSSILILKVKHLAAILTHYHVCVYIAVCVHVFVYIAKIIYFDIYIFYPVGVHVFCIAKIIFPPFKNLLLTLSTSLFKEKNPQNWPPFHPT